MNWTPIRWAGGLALFVVVVAWASDAFRPWELAATFAALFLGLLTIFCIMWVAGDADDRLERELRPSSERDIDDLIDDIFKEEAR